MIESALLSADEAWAMTTPAYSIVPILRRHIDPVQEEVFVVLDGTLTIHMGEGDDPARHELERGSVLVVQPGTALQLSNRGEDELRLFIYGAPPEQGQATFLQTIE